MPFTSLVELIFNHKVKDRVIIHDPELAAYIAAHDPAEQFIHLENGNELWLIEDWRVDIKRTSKIKAESERNRYFYCRTEELRQDLIKVLMKKFHFDEERAKLLASEHIRNKDVMVCKMLYGVDISELIKLENKR